jgi:hypothetical protein
MTVNSIINASYPWVGVLKNNGEPNQTAEPYRTRINWTDYSSSRTEPIVQAQFSNQNWTKS